MLLIDADLGLANVDVILGLNSRYTINDVIKGKKSISEVVVQGPGGLNILPGASGVSDITTLEKDEKLHLLQQLDSFETRADTVIIDTAAGISDMVLYFNTAVQDRLVVATGEPTSLTDAYALIKVLSTQRQEKRFKLVVNNVRGSQEAKQVFSKLSVAVGHFLNNVSLEYMGYIPSDPVRRPGGDAAKAGGAGLSQRPGLHRLQGTGQAPFSHPCQPQHRKPQVLPRRRLVNMA